MIKLHRINGKEIVINCEMIELMEETPDTVITLNNGNKMVVQEKVGDIIDLVVEFKKRCLFGTERERVE